MKRINLFVTFILIACFSLSAVSCIMGDRVVGNGKLVTEERTVSFFNGLSASTGLDVVITQGEKDFIEVESDDNLIEYIITEVRDGILKIHWKNNINVKKYTKAVVRVTFKHLNSIKASSSADIYGKGVIRAESIKISASSAADVELTVEAQLVEGNASSSGDLDLDVTADKIELSSSSGADIDIKGAAEMLIASVSSGADIDAKKFIAKKADVSASSGGDIDVHVSDELEVSASSGGDVTYYGDPKITDLNVSSGGDITKGRF